MAYSQGPKKETAKSVIVLTEEILHQWSLAVYPIVYRVLCILIGAGIFSINSISILVGHFMLPAISAPKTWARKKAG